MTTTTRKPQRTAARCTVPPPAQARGQRPEASPAGRRHPNPARGLRGDFHKVTSTLPLDTLRDLRLLGLARRAQGATSTGVSELVREAIHDLLERAHETPPSRTP